MNSVPPTRDAVSEVCRSETEGISDRPARVLADCKSRDLQSVRTQIQRRYACSWMPHSVFSVPAQRPSRPEPGWVQGAQPIDSYPWSCRGL